MELMALLSSFALYLRITVPVYLEKDPFCLRPRTPSVYYTACECQQWDTFSLDACNTPGYCLLVRKISTSVAFMEKEVWDLLGRSRYLILYVSDLSHVGPKWSPFRVSAASCLHTRAYMNPQRKQRASSCKE